MSARAELTPRQAQIAAAIGLGRSNKQIAVSLGLSPHTVREHVSVLLAKTKTTSRTELAMHLAERQFLEHLWLP
jgi:DNA-binding NarL/FixJ family response regulator